MNHIAVYLISNVVPIYYKDNYSPILVIYLKNVASAKILIMFRLLQPIQIFDTYSFTKTNDGPQRTTQRTTTT